MAHKAKPKRKPNPETSSSVTKKSNQKTAPKQQTKTKPDAEATKNDNKEPTSYSFTQVVRVRNNSSIEASAPFKKRYLPSLDTDSKSSVLLYHKREKRTQGIDIIGVQLLNTWKKSAGRSKSWRSCRRLKITPGDLEFLIESKNSPVSFGWPFSSSITPSTFSRSRDLRINQSLGRRSNRSSNIPVSRDLVEDYGRHWPLPRGRPYKRSIPLSENIEFRGGISYLRLQLDHGTVSMTQGEFLSIIDLPKPQTLPRSSSRKQHPSKSLPEQLIVIDLLRNESHADVYVVRSPNIPTQIYHAHAFLNNNLSGNWSTFSRRKMERLRKSIGFRGETVQDGMKILIMEDISKFNEVYHVKNKQQEFPLLPQTDQKQNKIRPKKMKLSYAAVVGRNNTSKRSAGSNYPGYQGWKDRRQGVKKTGSTSSQEIKTSHPKVEDFASWFRQVSVRKLPLSNRYEAFSKEILESF